MFDARGKRDVTVPENVFPERVDFIGFGVGVCAKLSKTWLCPELKTFDPELPPNVPRND
tara:strand:+ start:2507 stop:2683 length:177 start_codon:yes stop_codon:yes gene_type:complete